MGPLDPSDILLGVIDNGDSWETSLYYVYLNRSTGRLYTAYGFSDGWDSRVDYEDVDWDDDYLFRTWDRATGRPCAPTVQYAPPVDYVPPDP